ncbi:DUF6338 family protein [Phytomonospora sp. NPDC050363]|uniref:DUF6338 family protein n=1 Tax=Phytomonospora sp. NPDC050363 TaxID=3155642 RepID=UPI0033C0D0F9
MPSTVQGLLVLIVGALPGFVFVLARRRRFPAMPESLLREATQVVAASLLACLASGAVLSVAGWVGVPAPHVRAWILEPRLYLADNLGLLAVWTTTGLLLAVVGAAAAGRYLPSPRGRIRPSSAWWDSFQREPDTCGAAATFVRCHLNNGSYVAGTLESFTSQEIPGHPRELVLEAPLTFRPSWDEKEVPMEGNRIIVDAERIMFTQVGYMIEDPRRAHRSRRTEPDAAC